MGSTVTPSGRRYANPVEVMTPNAAGGPALPWSTFSAKDKPRPVVCALQNAGFAETIALVLQIP